jgi:hypothetical protein
LPIALIALGFGLEIDMKNCRLVAVALFIGMVSPVSAYENFIPLGTGYSSEVDSVPELNTKRDKVSIEADIIESEIYRKERDSKARESFFRRFVSDHELTGSDYSIDY